jgi:hypothetical protein
MILLQQDATNQVTLTLSEKQDVSGSLYLIELYNKSSNQTFQTYVQDISTDTISYNMFYIPVSSSGLASTGSFVLTLPGFYSYSFYVSGSTQLLEHGKAEVLSSATSSAIYFTSSVATASVFNPRQYGQS